MLLFMKAIRHLCADSVSAAAERQIFTDIVTAEIKSFSTLNKHEFERRKSVMHSDYAVLELMLMAEDKYC